MAGGQGAPFLFASGPRKEQAGLRPHGTLWEQRKYWGIMLYGPFWEAGVLTCHKFYVSVATATSSLPTNESCSWTHCQDL